MRGLRVWTLAILLAASSPAAAQPTDQAPARAQLPLVAAGGCATPAAVVEGVRRRSARIEFSDVGDASAAQLRVAIQSDPRGGATAELAVQWPDGRRAERRLEAASCGDALEAVALLIALMLDPTAPGPAPAHAGERRAGAARGKESRDGAQAERPPQLASDAAMEAPEAATEPAPVADAAAEEAQRAVGTPAEPPAPAAAAVPSASAPESPAAAPLDDEGAPDPLAFEQLAFGASAELVSGPAPELMPGIGLSVLVGLRGSGLFAPALMLRASHVLRESLSEPGGVADFELDLLQLALCPVRLRAAAFSARACLAGSIGSLSASGSGSYSPRSEARLWADLGAALRFALDLYGPVQLQAGFGASVALRRYRFAFSPDVFYGVPPLRLVADIGLGLRFP